MRADIKQSRDVSKMVDSLSHKWQVRPGGKKHFSHLNTYCFISLKMRVGNLFYTIQVSAKYFTEIYVVLPFLILLSCVELQSYLSDSLTIFITIQTKIR